MTLKKIADGSFKKVRGFTEGRRERANDAAEKAKAEGLLNVGKEHEFYKTLGIGEARHTSFIAGQKGTTTGKIREQWWAPARLVRFNRVLVKEGFSSKLRAKALRCMADGKELPERYHEALARYTEEVFSRR